jgi:hypothetical protein
MMRSTAKSAQVGVVVAASLTLAAGIAARQSEPVDQAAIAKIRDEGLNRSQVWAHFTMLTDGIGPRLTGSPEYKRAAEWSAARMREWQLANVRIEPFEFGRGWTLETFTIDMVEPRYMPLLGYPEAWSPATNGEVIVPVVSIAGQSPGQVTAMAGRLKGAAVLQAAPVTNFITADRVQPTAPDAPPPPPPAGGQRQGGGRQGGARQGGGGGRQGAAEINQAIQSAGAAVLLRPSRGMHGTVFVAAGRDNPKDQLPKVVLAGEHYNMIARLLERNIPVRLRVNVQSKFLDVDRNSYNILAEIPGTDPALRDEIVMLGAHLDSWHTGVGATDNADGSAAALEAFRILKAAGLQPKRTLRLALWGGEEQGLLGSAAYVRQHLAGQANTAAREKLAVYFNIDPGKGPIYGWFLENNPAVAPIFDAWLAPFTDLGARKNVPQGIGNTDHLSFTRNGMMGFNPVQDYVDYDVREHHTNADTPERIREQDLKQNAVILAAFVYHAANRAARLPAPPAK